LNFAELQQRIIDSGKQLVPLKLIEPNEPLPSDLYHIGNPEGCSATRQCFDIQRIDWKDPDQGGYIAFVSGVNQGYSGGPVVDEVGRVIGMIEAKKGRTTMVLPIHSARNLLWSFGAVDVYPDYTDFKLEFTKLRQAVLDLQEQLDYLKERLDWEVTLQPYTVPIPGTGRTVDIKFLRIDFTKSFPEQYSPDGIYVRIGIILNKVPDQIGFQAGLSALVSDTVRISFDKRVWDPNRLKGSFTISDIDGFIEVIRKKAAEQYQLYFHPRQIRTLQVFATPFRIKAGETEESMPPIEASVDFAATGGGGNSG